MEINNARSAREYVSAWANESPTAQARYLGGALKGQEFCARMSESMGQSRAAAGYRAAIKVLRRALARIVKEG